MRTPEDDMAPDELTGIADTVRRYGPEPTALQLDAVKRRVMLRASRGIPPKGPWMRSKLVTLLLAAGLTVTGGTAGVMAAGGGGPDSNSAAKSQYVDGKCNAGNGNGSDAITTVPGEHCYMGDPGNSFNAGNRGGDEIPTSGGNPNPGGNNDPGNGAGKQKPR